MIMHVMIGMLFFRNYNLWSCQRACEALIFLFYSKTIFILDLALNFIDKLSIFLRVLTVPPFAADLFLPCN